MSEYISVQQAARMLGVRVEEIYRKLYSGKLTGFRDSGRSGSGRAWKVNKDSVQRVIEDRRERGKGNKNTGV